MTDETLIEHRVGQVESAIRDIREALTGINASLVTLTKLEVRHSETRDALARAHSRIDEADRRLTAIEQAMPVLKLTSHWVKGGVIGIVTLVLMAVGKLVLI